MVEINADEILVWFRRTSCWNVDLYGIGDRKECWRDPRLIWLDQKGPAIEKVGLYEPVIEKGAGGALCTKPAVDFDACKAIFIHNLYYSPSYFSFVKFIFFNCVLIFSRFRKIDDDQFHLIISVRSIFSYSEREKAIYNNEIKIIIADHTHAWAEIWASYG